MLHASLGRLGSCVLSVRLCRQHTMPYSEYSIVGMCLEYRKCGGCAVSVSISLFTNLNYRCCLHRSKTNNDGTGEPEEQLGMHRSRFALRSRCYFVVNEQKETFIFVNGYSYPVKTLRLYPNTKIKVSSLFCI